jgi:hypothetical protein
MLMMMCIFAILLHTCIQYPGQSPACEDNVWASIIMGVLALACEIWKECGGELS